MADLTAGNAALILGSILTAATLLEKALAVWRGKGEREAQKALAAAKPVATLAEVAARVEDIQASAARWDKAARLADDHEEWIDRATKLNAEPGQIVDKVAGIAETTKRIDGEIRAVDKTLAAHNERIKHVEEWRSRMSGTRIPQQR